MNEVQQSIHNAINSIKAIPKEYHHPKWRNKVIDRLEELEAIAAKVPNMEHPHNQPLPEADDKPIDLDDIRF